jgi:hypothetical protein
LQQNKIQGLKQKIHEHTRTKTSFKSWFNINSIEMRG